MRVRRERSAPGFTLLELLATLAVLGIVAAGGALVWPRLDAALRLEAGVHQVAADLHDARGLAVASAARARLSFTPGATSYRLERADDDGGYRLAALRMLPRGIRIDGVNSGGDLGFSARGHAENGTVVLADRRGVRASLRLNQRGRVTIDRGRT
jgi:prepilin-type N-terminal cleavage/methylation domain-containing protein